MTKRILSAVLVLALVFSMIPTPANAASETDTTQIDYWDGKAATSFDSGSGTSADPYVVKTAEQLAYMAQRVNAGSLGAAKVILARNIDLSGYTWTPIGNSSGRYFTGEFNGNGYTISGLQIQSSNGIAGLFGYTSGVVENLKLTISNYSFSYGSATIYAGAVAAYNTGTIRFVEVSGNITVKNANSTTYYVNCGGIAGYNGFLVEACAYSGNITVNSHGGYYCGGLLGDNAGILKTSYFKGNVTGKKTAASDAYTYCILGGLVGGNRGTVENCYAIAAVNNNVSYTGSNAIAGGLVGEAITTSSRVSKCFAQNSVYTYGSGSGSIAGGLVGHARGTIIYCYANNKVEATGNEIATTAGRIVGGNDSCSVNTTYYNSSTILSKVNRREWKEKDGCDEVTKVAYDTVSDPSNTIYTGTATYSASFFSGTLRWGEYTTLGNAMNNVSEIWVLDGDRPYLYTERIYSLTVAYHKHSTKGTTTDHVFFSWLDNKQNYIVETPTRTGYTPNKDKVSVTITEDTIVDVVYEQQFYDLTVALYTTGGILIGTEVYQVGYGDTYEVIPSERVGYTRVTEKLTGTMGAGEQVVEAYYEPVVYTLTVEYVFEDGTTAAPTKQVPVEYNGYYYIASPKVEGYAADPALISGYMPAGDKTVTVTYSANSYVITVIHQDLYGNILGEQTMTESYMTSLNISSLDLPGYTAWEDDMVITVKEDATYIFNYSRNYYTVTIYLADEDGNPLVDTHYVYYYQYGDSYAIDVPAFEGLTPDRNQIQGTMGAENVEITVTYTVNTYPLYITYQYSDGTLIREDVWNIQQNTPYAVTPDQIPYFTPDMAVVEGVMGEEAVYVTVTYSRNVLGSGACGDDMTWTLYEDGKLTFTGTGAMYDYAPGTAPWYAHRADVRSYSFDDGITSIGAYAFYGCYNFHNVYIPKNISSIGDGAFAACDDIASFVVDPENTHFLVDQYALLTADRTVLVAFPTVYCTRRYVIPEGVTTIAPYAFYNNNFLWNVTVPDTVTTIGASAFENASELEKIELPAPTLTVGERAFCNSGLNTLIVDGNITSLGDFAFATESIRTVYFKGDVPANVGQTIFGSDSLTQERLCLYYSTGNETWLREITVSSDANGYKTEYWRGYRAYAYSGVGDVTLDNSGDEQVYAIFVYCDKTPIEGVSVTFDGETRQTDKDGFTYFVYTDAVQVNLRIHKDKYVSSYEATTAHNLRDLGVEYFTLTTNSDVSGLTCYGNDITTSIGYINVKYDGDIPIVVKGNTAFNITKMELYQRVPDAKNPDAPWINKILQTITPDDDEITEDGYGKFVVKASAFAYNADVEYPIFVRMYTDSGENAVEKQLRIKTMAISITGEYGNLLGDAKLTLSDTGVPFLDGMTLKLKSDCECPLSIKIVNNEVYITWDLDDDAFDSVVSSVTGVNGMGDAIKNKMENTETRVKNYMNKVAEKADKKLTTKTKAFSARKHTADFSLEPNIAGGICFTVGEDSEILSIRSYMKASIEMKASWTAQYWILWVPVVLEIEAKAQGEFEIVGLGYDLQNSKWMVPDVNMNVEASLEVSLGVGCQVISAGVFARLKLEAALTLGEVTHFDGLLLSGEWGFYAKLDVGLFSLEEEKAWEFMNVELIPKTATAQMFSAPNDTGYMGQYKGLAVYDLSAYSLQRSVDVEDVKWVTDFSLDVEPDAYAYAEPQLITCSSTSLVVYLADDQNRNAYNAQKLVYRIYDETSDQWSDAYQLDANGTSDSSFSLAIYNDTIYVAYAEAKQAYTDEDMTGKTDQQMAINVSMAQEVVVAAYNPGTQRFERFTTLTNNGYFDASPVLEQIGDKLYVAWTTNYATDDSLIFGMNGSNDVNLCYFDGNNWSDPEIIVSDCNPISEMALAELDGKACVAMLIDEDANYYTNDDSNIYIADAQGNVTFIDCYGEPVGSLQTAVYQGQKMLTWYCGGGIKKLTSLNTAPDFFLEQKFAITQDYRLVHVTEDVLALTWSIKGIKDSGQQYEKSIIYMKLIDHTGEWTDTAVAFSAPYYMMSYDLTGTDGDMRFVYIKTAMKPGDDGAVTMNSKLCAHSLTTGYDLQIGEITNIKTDSATGKVSLDAVLSNTGVKTVHQISVMLAERDAITGNVIEYHAIGLYQVDLLSGEEKTIQIVADLIDGVDMSQASVVINVYEDTEEAFRSYVARLNDALSWTGSGSTGSGSGEGSDTYVESMGGVSGSTGGIVVRPNWIIVDSSLSTSKPTYPKMKPDLELKGEYVIVGDTEYLSLKVTNLAGGTGVAQLNVTKTAADGSIISVYTANIMGLDGGSIKYYLVELRDDYFETDTETFNCWLSYTNPDDPADNNSLSIEAVRMEGAGGTERDDNAVASQLSSYNETYDKNSDQDLELDITLNGNNYVGLRDLEANEYATYTMNPDGTVLHMTVSQVYLKSLALGEYEQVFLFLTQCGYIDCVLNLSIIDTTPIELTGNINLTGSPQRGELLTVDISQLNTDEVTYAWTVDGEVVSQESVYLVDNQALGKYLSVTVTGDGLYRGSFTTGVYIPKVDRNINAPKVTIVNDDTLQLKKGFVVGDGTVEYGWASVNDPDQVTNWTTDNTVVFQWDDLYYLFMRVTGSDIYEDAVSEAVIYSNRDVNLSIDKVSLRSNCAGLYFTGTFDIKEGVSVTRTGIAVSLYNQLPTADGSDETSLWTEDSTSVLIANILTQENNALANNNRAMMPIYARAYAELADGTIVYSEAVCVNLRSLVEAVDAKFDKLSDAQRAEFVAMYELYADTMSRWNIPNLKAQ